MAVSRSSSPDESRVTVLSGGSSAAGGSPPLRLGRYVIEGVLGAGGMATVYLARDPVLDRAVALKVLRVDDDERGAARLIREGQALARVSHRNVIHVYEVGREAGLIYVAMERIVGVTLAAWLDAPRTEREILEVFAAAGRGLAAAHAAGLVHRDFKPENAMVGDDGRVCVLDFGLARQSDDDAVPGAAGRSSGALTATAFGSVIGTPAYMSPEQWRGERAGAASDQFSFCVALWRALTGEHPFDASSREALRASVLAGAVRRPPRSLPRRLRSVLHRGLAADPRARFSSIHAVVAAIRPRHRLRRLLAPAAIAALAIGGGLAATTGEDESATTTTLYAAPVPITSRGDVARSAVSADGQRVAMLTRDAVVVQPLTPGAAQRIVLRGRLAYHALSWSPDGKELALVASPAGSTAPPGTHVIDLATGSVRRIGGDLGALALIGGGELVAAGFADQELAFYTYDGTAAAHRRCPLPGHSGVRRLAFDAARAAVVVQLDDSDRRSSLLVIDRQCRSVTTAADRLPILSFVIRPGDHRVLMREMWGSHHLVEIAGDGTSRLGQHVIQSNDYLPLAVLPDGRIAHRDQSTRWALHAIDRGRAGVELASGAAESRFSFAPDGRIAQIDGLYDRGRLRVGRLDVHPAEPGGSNALDGAMTTLAERIVRAVWSPDGRRLAVLEQTDDGYRLATCDPATGAMSAAHLLPTPYDVELTWLDGDRVAYPVLHARTEFRWIDVARGTTGILIPAPGRETLSLVRAHGDRRLAFVTVGAGGVTVWTLIEGSAPHALATVPADSLRPTRTARVAWAAGDRSLVLFDEVTGELWSIAADGAEAGEVARISRSELPRGGLARVTGVFPLADGTIVASATTSADIYTSAPIAE